MRLVIDIPKKEYEKYKRIGDSRDILFEAIRKGVLLPKGHGRLIDAGALDKEVINHVHSGNAESPKDCAKFSIMIITAPTIIEADKEAEDGV